MYFTDIHICLMWSEVNMLISLKEPPCFLTKGPMSKTQSGLACVYMFIVFSCLG